MQKKAKKEFWNMNHNLNFKVAPRSEIVAKVEEAVMFAPEEVPVNILLTGTSAKKFHIIKTLITSSMPDLEEDDVVKYILRAGVEREFEKFFDVIK